MKLFLAALIFVHSFALQAAEPRRVLDKPKMVLVLVIDQFRADYLMRFSSRFLPAKSAAGVGGLNYLTSEGAYFPYGEHELMQDQTGPGHAAILTGSLPYQNGLPTNDWFDLKTKKEVYCVEDPSVKTVGANPSDPHVGTSPRNLIGTTVGDELKNAGWKSKVVSLALKDRSAILMGGHRADLVFWFDTESYRWVSSEHYLPQKELPEFLKKLNKDLEKEKGQTIVFNPEGKATGLSHADPPTYRTVKDLGQTFPHSAKKGVKSSISLPFGVAITFDAAKAAVNEMKLGQSGPDILAVSLSAHDYLGHTFGPNSLEMEEMIVAEDKMIADFLRFLDGKIGLKNIAIVLTGDHGVAPNPMWAKKHKINANVVHEPDLQKAIEEHLDKKLGSSGKTDWILNVGGFNIYFNEDLATEKKISFERVEKEIKAYLETREEHAFVITRHEMLAGIYPPGLVGVQARKTFYPKRSGHVVWLVKPFHLNSWVDVNHVTGYSYDRHIPIVFTGRWFKQGQFTSPAMISDIAPTLSVVLGTIPPALSEGKILPILK